MSFDRFVAEVSRATGRADCPHAETILQNVPIYSSDQLLAASSTVVSQEIETLLDSGPGILVIRDSFPDPAVLDRATRLFEGMIEAERTASRGKGDHFAAAGANDRVWNALQKHALADAQNYCDYFANPAIDLVSRAWLGDGYQMTAQVNRVNPGGAAQRPHRDYHLGFMDRARMATFPDVVHQLSPRLTLQGAIAHCDMPLEMGPTVYLPFSQRYGRGYLDFSEPLFQNYFAQHHVQLPLAKGDLVFFNPAVMHGAGHNRTGDRPRLANLLQVSSAFGRAMEAVDRAAIVAAIYPYLQLLTEDQQRCVIACSAEGYAFPTNLDNDPPLGGMAPATQAQLLRQALAEDWPANRWLDWQKGWSARRMP